MNVDRIKITNFKKYRNLDLRLSVGMNVLVGDNDSGKSTILEAIDIALSGIYRGRYIKAELSQSMFSNECVYEFLSAMKLGDLIPPPEIGIEIFMTGDEAIRFRGNLNSEGDDLCGFLFSIRLDGRNQDLYQEWVDSGDFESLPVELYNSYIVPFSRDEELTHRHIPLKSALIDTTSIRTNGDLYLSKILKDVLTSKEMIDVSRAFRNSNAAFSKDISITAINDRIKDAADITDRSLSLCIDPPAKNGWESSLQTFIDEVPFYANGKGEQSIIKTKIALSHKKARTKNLLLIEEPENHLSHATLNKLLHEIKLTHVGRQVVLTTHSNFVANKLGLSSLIFLGPTGNTRLDSLDLGTQDFFEKIAGYDTLRMLLCKKAILVEGASDELIVQRAYMDKHEERLPIEDGIDVISVGTAFERFLKLAECIGTRVAVVTDNDGDPDFLSEKFTPYASSAIRIYFDKTVDTGPLVVGKKAYNYNTLEPKIIKVNDTRLLNEILGTNFELAEDLQKYMLRWKVDCALKIFESKKSIIYPQYIMDAIA